VTTIVIFTHETRERELARTVKSIRDANLYVDFISLDTGPGSPMKNRLNAMNALRNGYVGEDILVLEDDVMASINLASWLRYLHFNVHQAVCLLPMKPEFYSERTEVILRNERMRKATPSRLEVNPRLMHWWGSQALWFPPRIAEGILNDERFSVEDEKPMGPWDHAIRQFLMGNNEEMLMAFPAVFQHQSPPSVRQRKNRRQRLAAIFDPESVPPAP